MDQSSRENLTQCKGEIIRGAKQLRAELEAYGPDSGIPHRGDSIMMCEAVLEYFDAEEKLGAFETGAAMGCQSTSGADADVAEIKGVRRGR